MSPHPLCPERCQRSPDRAARLSQAPRPPSEHPRPMARIQILFVDDLDGREAENTVRFGLDGAEYEIDLNAGDAQALRRCAGAVAGGAVGRGGSPGGQFAADVGHRPMG